MAKQARIEYTSPNGCKGVLYGRSSMIIQSADGTAKIHTGSRTPNTLEELIPLVDGFPEFMDRIHGMTANMGIEEDEDDGI